MSRFVLQQALSALTHYESNLDIKMLGTMFGANVRNARLKGIKLQKTIIKFVSCQLYLNLKFVANVNK